MIRVRMAPIAAIIRPDLLPGGILVLMLPLNAFVAWRERSHSQRTSCLRCGFRLVLIIQSSPVQNAADRDERGQLRPIVATVAGRVSR